MRVSMNVRGTDWAWMACGEGWGTKGAKSGETSAAYFLLIGFRFFPFSVLVFSVGVFVSDGDVDAGDSDSRSAFVRATGMAEQKVTCRSG